MTKQETREKIVDIISEGILYGEDNYGMPTDKTIENIADALIAAGIVDKSDYASMKETAVRYKAEVSKAESRAKDAEHRAEVAEKALKSEAMCHVLKYFPNELSGLESCMQEVYEAWIYQAEKELAEEGEDGNKTD